MKAAGIFVEVNMKTIPLTQGKFAKVGDEDYKVQSKWSWYFKQGYACRNSTDESGKRITLMMHREIMQTPANMDVDHRDLDGLNNQRYNLRNCSRGENRRNTKAPRTNTSGYKGVGRQERLKKWQAQIRVNGKIKYLGIFTDAEDAARAYDEAARKYFGEFARTNFELP